MSEVDHSSKEDDVKPQISVSGWVTKLDDDREIFVGHKSDDPDEGFRIYFRNKDFKSYLCLSVDAGFALLASLESAIEWRRARQRLTSLAFKVNMSAEDAAKMPVDSGWQLIQEEGDEQ